MVILDLFAGPGGWDEAVAQLGHTSIGIEWDKAACLTAKTAGHLRIRADVAEYPTQPFAGKVTGLIASPPCQAWSMAGNRKGELDRANCHVLADRMAGGDDSTDWTDWEDDRSPLVCQPIRWVRDLHPDWVALEEVPAVASLWMHFAHILRGWGYSVWTGDLCAADYGVPQTRVRRILAASLTTVAQAPDPTHVERSQGVDLFGGTRLTWISMAEALGWGATRRPSPTVTAGGAATGGAEPFTRGSRDTLERERASGRWALHTNRDQRADGSRQTVSVDQPAPTLTAKSGGQWEVRPEWAFTRPATTVVGSFSPDVIAGPGYRTSVSRQNAEASVKVTVAEASVLQSFRPDYPWQGSRTKQFQQVGNAIPPLLARAVLAQFLPSRELS